MVKQKSEMTVSVIDLPEALGLLSSINSESKRNTEVLEEIATRLDVIINLLLDIVPEDKFIDPRKLTHKVGRLDRTGIALRPIEIGKMLGRPSKDIVSRRREFNAQASKKVAKTKMVEGK